MVGLVDTFPVRFFNCKWIYFAFQRLYCQILLLHDVYFFLNSSLFLNSSNTHFFLLVRSNKSWISETSPNCMACNSTLKDTTTPAHDWLLVSQTVMRASGVMVSASRSSCVHSVHSPLYASQVQSPAPQWVQSCQTMQLWVAGVVITCFPAYQQLQLSSHHFGSDCSNKHWIIIFAPIRTIGPHPLVHVTL